MPLARAMHGGGVRGSARGREAFSRGHRAPEGIRAGCTLQHAVEGSNREVAPLLRSVNDRQRHGIGSASSSIDDPQTKPSVPRSIAYTPMTAMAYVLEQFDLTGKGVAITGGGGYLGRPTALGLAEAGATVVVCGRSEAPLAEVASEASTRGLRGRVIPFVADISTDDGVGAVLDRVEQEAGSVYGWVNNAYSGAGGKLLELTRAQVEASVAGGLTAALVAADLAARRMVKAGSGGAIVNVATMYGMVSPKPSVYREHPQFHNPPAYGAAKAGLIQFTRYAGCHLAPHGIRVNCVSPGPFPWGAPAAQTGFVDELCKQVPMGRVGRAHEIAGAVLFLLSPASSYITGQNLAIDGGWTAW